MLQLIVLFGLPASGKSTFAYSWVNKNPTTRVRINRDDIRHQLGKYWVPQREKLVTEIERNSVYSALCMGYNVVVDSTNLSERYYHWPALLEGWKKGFVSDDFPEVELIENKSFLDVPIEECIRRDSLRPAEERVGEEVIRRMARNLE